ncbi:MAG: hypothetical protein A3H29_14020 [Acidobacteria bacterium RIFCSPLOWO2_02_FULL_67_21]|nr:MAG: hypothetical protein A3H29_14020 [Acidobacteria bacterium RIFCSPLOWO2_02_FULL_67_21]
MNRLIRSNDDVADDRVHTVGANEEIGVCRRAVLEREPHLAAPFVDAGKLLLEVDGRGGHAGEQRLMEVAAVHAQVRRAEEALRHRQLAQDLARVPDAVEMRVGLKRRPAHAVLDADAPQHLHGVRHHLEAGADDGTGWFHQDSLRIW